MNIPNEEREYRVEWRTGGVFSYAVAAHSPAEAVAMAREVPLEDDGWEVEGITDQILAFPVDYATQARPDAEVNVDLRDPVERNYCVSYEFGTTYSQNVYAVDWEAASRKVAREDSGWHTLSEWEHWHARPMPAS